MINDSLAWVSDFSGCFVLQEHLSDRLEKQQQEKALQLYLSQVDELDQWLLRTRSMLSSTLQDLDTNEQLSHCQVRASACHIHYCYVCGQKCARHV